MTYMRIVSTLCWCFILSGAAPVMAAYYNQAMEYIVADGWPIDEPKASLKKAQRLLKQETENSQTLIAALEAGYASYHLARFKSASDYYARALTSAKQQGDTEAAATANFYYIESLLSLNHYEKVIELSTAQPVDELQKLQLIRAYLHNNQIEQGEKLAGRLLTSENNHSILPIVAYTHGVVADFNAQRYHYSKAKHHYQQALDSIDYADHASLKVAFNLALARLNQQMDNHQEAIAVLKMLLALHDDVLSDAERSAVLLLLVDELIRVKQYLQAREFAARAVAISEADDDDITRLKAIALWGISYAEQGINDRAMKKFTAVLEEEKSLPEKDALTLRFYNQLASLLLIKNDIASAQKYFNQVLKISRQMNDLEQQQTALDNLSQLAANEQDFKAAYQYRAALMLVYRQVQNQLLEKNRFESIAPFISENENLNQALNQATKKLQYAQLAYKQEKQNYHYALGALLSTLMALGLWLAWLKFYHHRRMDKKQNELVSVYEQLEDVARKDPLTEMYNRVTTEDIIKQQCMEAESSRTPISLVIIAIDNYFEYLDDWGQDCADFALVTIAEALDKLTRQQDLCGRWNEEDFLLVLPNTDITKASVVVEKIKDAIADSTLDYFDKEKNEAKKLQMTISASIGEYRPGLNDIDLVISNIEKTIDASRLHTKNKLSLVQ